MSADWAKQLGWGASIPRNVSEGTLVVQAKIDSSSDFLMISSCSLMNAFAPSPYSKGMFTSKRPSMQYAKSSTLMVFLPETQLIFVAIQAPDQLSRCSCLIPVAIDIWFDNIPLVPKARHCPSRNITVDGARSSCNVQPRVNHKLSMNFVIDARLFLKSHTTSQR